MVDRRDIFRSYQITLFLDFLLCLLLKSRIKILSFIYLLKLYIFYKRNGMNIKIDPGTAFQIRINVLKEKELTMVARSQSCRSMAEVSRASRKNG